jgi:hypothetical protein
VSELHTQDAYVCGKLVIPKRFTKAKVVAGGAEWDGSWEQACFRLFAKLNREKYRDRIIANNRKYRNSSKGQEKAVELRQSKVSIKSDYDRKYRSNNKDRVRAVRSLGQRVRRQTNPYVRFSDSVRHLVKESFKRSVYQFGRPSEKSHEILGCSLPEFYSYISSQFVDGMTASNYGYGDGKWVIDHIIPIKAAQDLSSSVEEFKAMVIKLNHHTNLRPMWFKDNEAKGEKYDKDTAVLLLCV